MALTNIERQAFTFQVCQELPVGGRDDVLEVLRAVERQMRHFFAEEDDTAPRLHVVPLHRPASPAEH